MKLGIIIIFLFSFAQVQLRAQEKDACAVHLKHLPQDGVLLDRGWKLQAGDNPEWAGHNYDDSGWQAVDPTKEIKVLPTLWQHSIVWFRLHLCLDSVLRQQSLVLVGGQAGASEIYLNGRLIKQLGVVSPNPEKVQALTLPYGQVIVLPLGSGSEQVLAVRFALQKDLPYFQFGNVFAPALSFRLNETNAAVDYANLNDITSFEYFRIGFFFILAILHLAFFWFYPAQRANMYFFLYALFSALAAWMINSAYKTYSVEAKVYLLILGCAFVFVLNYVFYLMALYRLFNQSKGIYFWTLTVGLILFFGSSFWFYQMKDFLIDLIFLLIPLETMRVAIIAIRRKQRGARIVAGGAICFSLSSPFLWLWPMDIYRQVQTGLWVTLCGI
ncbi:hypothetical protein [Pontibacter pamirensis]|uniref:hypothetical protein n=1 Tax=Pontibacter pamirensis TaxID=2562824 RepID=UPI00138A1120|nr:hypothetical protein [Pontibacter pamirensis]